MANLTIKVSAFFKEEVLKKAKEIAEAGKTEDVLGIESYGPLKVYVDIEPKKYLHVFNDESTLVLKGKKIYVGSDE